MIRLAPLLLLQPMSNIKISHQIYRSGKVMGKILMIMTVVVIPIACLYWLAQVPTTNSATNLADTPISKNHLVEARQLYQNRQYTLASQEFAQHVKIISRNRKPEQEMEWLEAQLGAVLCSILAEDATWTSQLQQCELDQRGSWQGKFFTYLEYIKPTHVAYFNEKSVDGKLPAHYFLLIQLIIQENHTQILSDVINRAKQPQLLWDFCLLIAWDYVQQAQFTSAQTLLEICKKHAITPIQWQEFYSATDIISILQNPEQIPQTSQPQTSLKYSFQLNSIDILRPASPLFQHQKIITVNPGQWYHIMLADLLFCMGAQNNKHTFFWSQGLKFVRTLEKIASSDMKVVYYALAFRLQTAMAWDCVNQGDLSQAQSIFEKCFDTKGTPWYQEARLGLAIVAYKQGKTLTELLIELEDAEIEWEYWLGGNKISFFRSIERKQHQARFETISQDKRLKIGFILFDVFCLLGEGYHANMLLNELAKLSSTSSPHPIFHIEESNIPKDEYSVCRIWEKLD